MYNFSTLKAELSAVNAAYDMKERNIKELTSEPLEDETIKFNISPHSETKFVQLPDDLINLGYTLSIYNILSRPKKVKDIVEIQESLNTKGLYLVTMSSFALPENIQKDLEASLLPF